MSRECLLNIVTKPKELDSSIATSFKSKVTPSAKLNQPALSGQKKSAAIRDYSYAIAKGMLSFIA